MVLRQALAACSRNLCTSVPIAAERVGSTLAAQEMSRAEGACACDNPGGGPRVREGRRESVPQEYSVLSEFSPIHARTRSPLTVGHVDTLWAVRFADWMVAERARKAVWLAGPVYTCMHVYRSRFVVADAVKVKVNYSPHRTASHPCNASIISMLEMASIYVR